MKKRVMFIKAGDSIYRVNIIGVSTEIHKTDFEENRRNLPPSLAKISDWKRGERNTHIREEIDLYSKTKWSQTNELEVVTVSRDSRDLIELKFNAR